MRGSKRAKGLISGSRCPIPTPSTKIRSTFGIHRPRGDHKTRGGQNKETADVARSSRATTNSPWRFLCVLGAFAVKVLCCINRQDAKSAKNFAKQNSFRESKDFQLSSTDSPGFPRARSLAGSLFFGSNLR